MPGELKLVTAVTAGVGAAVAALALYNAITWWKKPRVPTKWHKVGELVDIMCFPVKSCGVIKLKHSDCKVLGLQSGILRDRVFMVVDKNRRCLTARGQPELTQISPSVEDDILILKAGVQEPIRLNVRKLQNEARVKSSVWGQSVDVVDCGDEVAEWLTKYIQNGSEIKPRLVFYPQQHAMRGVRVKKGVFPKLNQKDTGALPDFTSFNMIAEASIEDLNLHLKAKKVTPLFFRPNFVVRGTKAYEEDSWDWVRIGDVVFQNVKPCTRCVFTTIDPETGIKDKDVEPLNTLKSYRQIMDPNIKPHVGESPVMGIHLALRVPGSVNLGDPIYVN